VSEDNDILRRDLVASRRAYTKSIDISTQKGKIKCYECRCAVDLYRESNEVKGRRRAHKAAKEGQRKEEATTRRHGPRQHEVDLNFHAVFPRPSDKVSVLDRRNGSICISILGRRAWGPADCGGRRDPLHSTPLHSAVIPEWNDSWVSAPHQTDSVTDRLNHAKGY
jgi:hypothetical protein